MATDDTAIVLSELAALRSEVSEVRRLAQENDATLARIVERVEANNAAWQRDLLTIRATVRRDWLSA